MTIGPGWRPRVIGLGAALMQPAAVALSCCDPEACTAAQPSAATATPAVMAAMITRLIMPLLSRKQRRMAVLAKIHRIDPAASHGLVHMLEQKAIVPPAMSDNPQRPSRPGPLPQAEDGPLACAAHARTVRRARGLCLPPVRYGDRGC